MRFVLHRIPIRLVPTDLHLKVRGESRTANGTALEPAPFGVNVFAIPLAVCRFRRTDEIVSINNTDGDILLLVSD